MLQIDKFATCSFDASKTLLLKIAKILWLQKILT